MGIMAFMFWLLLCLAALDVLVVGIAMMQHSDKNSSN